jgi:hypothetical protein
VGDSRLASRSTVAALFRDHHGGGWRTGWIGQGKYHPLPIRQPYSGFPITAW